LWTRNSSFSRFVGFHEIVPPDLTVFADGGSTRAISALMILEALMRKIEELERWKDRELGLEEEARLTSYAEGEDSPLPCHYFDYIVGSSSGG
jgi:hypothetical protein